VAARVLRASPFPPRWTGLRARWTVTAVRVGRLASWLSRRLGLGAGAVIGGRVTLALAPGALSRLAAGRQVVLVSGTNGKTTTAHMVAAALRTRGPVAHNASGANMPDGAVAALVEAPAAPYAVLEIDELYVGRVADAVAPAAVVLLNLSRDQLDRASEVRAVAASLSAALARHCETVVVANADDAMVVGAVERSPRVVWVAAGANWLADARTCPRCGRALATEGGAWSCACGLSRPCATWGVQDGKLDTPQGPVPLRLALPGLYNRGNAALAVAAAVAVGVPLGLAAAAISRLDSVAGRYSVIRRGVHELHLLLAKNPAGWAAMLPLLEQATSLLLVVNAKEADGRDTSWLWDVPFERLPARPTVASGQRAADVGLRLSYAEREHRTEPDPIAALGLLPAGQVYVVANYTAFIRLGHRLRMEEVR
jgi:UDP-N-acetylmuramyl tripeptide synthase